jgi:hypothetical protein
VHLKVSSSLINQNLDEIFLTVLPLLSSYQYDIFLLLNIWPPLLLPTHYSLSAGFRFYVRRLPSQLPAPSPLNMAIDMAFRGLRLSTRCSFCLFPSCPVRKKYIIFKSLLNFVTFESH